MYDMLNHIYIYTLIAALQPKLLGELPTPAVVHHSESPRRERPYHVKKWTHLARLNLSYHIRIIPNTVDKIK